MGSWSSDRIVETMPATPIVIDETSLETADAEPVELRVYRRAALISGTAAVPRVAKRPGTQPLQLLLRRCPDFTAGPATAALPWGMLASSHRTC